MGSLIRLILGILAIWFLYKLIFEFIVPVYRGTKQVRRQMRDMQDAMRQQFEQQQRQQQQAGPQVPPQAQEPARKRDDGDYIDFEEIK
jgi:Sec-independent protein translocase protein TatA